MFGTSTYLKKPQIKIEKKRILAPLEVTFFRTTTKWLAKKVILGGLSRNRKTSS